MARFRIAGAALLLLAACGTPPSATPGASAPGSSTATPPPGAIGSAAAPPSPTPQDLIIIGPVRTADDANPSAEAIAIQGDRILAVGSAADVRGLAGPSTMVIELPTGMVVLPGFIDSHQHRAGDQGFQGSGLAPELLQGAIAEGWTSINELFNDEERLANLQEMDDAGALHLRINAYLSLHNPQGDSYGTWYSAHEAKSDRSPYLRLAGVKIFMDHGWGIGEMIHTQADLDRMVADAHAAGWQLAVHTVGDEAHTSILDAIAAAGIAAADRPRIEHVIAVSDANIERMREAGAIASIQLGLPGYAIDGPDWQEGIIPPGHEDMFRWRDLADAGLHVAGSSDWPWISIDGGASSPVGLMYQAATRRTVPGREPQGWMTGQELTVEEAFRSLTIEGAYATFEDDRKGSLAAGKLADVVILSADPLRVDVEDMLGIQVVATMVGGRIEHCATGFDDLCAGRGQPGPTGSSPTVAPAEPSFAGTWTGVDPDDGSAETLTIVQDGTSLSAEFTDSFSGSIEPPGYAGSGSGEATSATSAAITFDLRRHDGAALSIEASLALSSDGQTLTFTFEGGKPVELTR